MRLPAGAEGDVLGTYQERGAERISVQGNGWYATDVPTGEVMGV